MTNTEQFLSNTIARLELDNANLLKDLKALTQSEQRLQAEKCELLSRINYHGCSFSGLGRGDCEHFTGLPGKSIPGQHDGKDDTVDHYGKPNGWCWHCWWSYRTHKAEKERDDLAVRLAQAEVDIGKYQIALQLAKIEEDAQKYRSMEH